MRIAAVLLCGLVLGAATPAPQGGQALVRLRLLSNGLLTAVPVGLYGKPAVFVLDTGASTLIVDSAVERARRMRVIGHRSVSGAGKGRVRSDRLAPVAVQFDAPQAKPLVFISSAPLGLDLGHVGTSSREDGLLGFDFFRGFVVDVDYDRGVVTLYDPRTYVYRGTGATLPIVIRRKHAYADVTVAAQGVEPQRHQVMIDLGSEDAIDDDIVLRSTAPSKRIQGGSGIGERFASTLGTVTTLQLGPYALRDLPSATGGVQLIGSAVWRKFHVVYDFAHARMYLEPRPGR